MAIKSDDKRISFGNKMKWSAPKYKVITIDPLTKQNNDDQKSRYTFTLTEVYANEDKFTLQHFDINIENRITMTERAPAKPGYNRQHAASCDLSAQSSFHSGHMGNWPHCGDFRCAASGHSSWRSLHHSGELSR